MSKVRSDNISNRADTGAPVLTYGAQVPVGYGITGAGFINVSGASTFSGNVSIAGTLTYEDVTNVDSVGIITARTGINVTAGGINAVGVVTATSFSGNITGGTLVGTGLSISGIGTIGDLNIKAAVETVSVGSTYDLGGGKVILECDATNGTIFTHNLTNGSVGIVSLRNFPVRGNSVTTFSIIFNQLSTTPTGTGNTTAATGIGTNITLTPLGVSGFSTSARVATASTVTLSTTANDVDIVTLAIHYNGSGTGTPGNYRVFATGNTGFRFGSIKP